MSPSAARMDDKLPSTVEAIRDGWQFTSQGGAVVSGLLAAVAAQLFSYFRAPGTYNPSEPVPQGQINAVVALCYAALFLNIGATISAFIILDKLGSLALTFARADPRLPNINTFSGTETQILQHYGGGSLKWKIIVWHWLICFYGGTTCLGALILTFIWLQETHWIRIIMSIVCGFVLIPSWLMIFM